MCSNVTAKKDVKEVKRKNEKMLKRAGRRHDEQQTILEHDIKFERKTKE